MATKIIYFPRNLSALILAAVLHSALIGGAQAQTKLVFVTPPNTIDTVTSEVITRKAYKRIGIDVQIKKFPGERALRLANSGKVDGEVQRINGIAAKYHNLIQINPAINYIQGTVFSLAKTFKVDGWESLRPYRIGYIRGIKFAENNTVNMDSRAVSDYKTMFQMLRKDRFDIIVSPRLNGLYQMKQLGIKQIKELNPAIMRFDLFHYLNNKHAALVPKISAVFKKMKADGELTKIRSHVIAVLMKRAEQKLPICDTDYKCFD
ncbi:MAG: transporter substrate-binding domain-containing protein [Rhodospirillaceae bacterium]|nr:transporter substrate-binding domain-containing protein [Rhodospirillaceae bacterium]